MTVAMRKNHDDEGVLRVSGGEGNFARGEYISRSVGVCARVFADPLRDGGRRQKTKREEGRGGREHERVGAERKGGRAREMAKSPGPPWTSADFALAGAEQAPARTRGVFGCARTASQTSRDGGLKRIVGCGRSWPLYPLSFCRQIGGMLMKEPQWTGVNL